MDRQMDKDAVFGCFVTQKVYGGTKVVIEKYGHFVFEFFKRVRGAVHVGRDEKRSKNGHRPSTVSTVDQVEKCSLVVI